jgi:hypothetical protein
VDFEGLGDGRLIVLEAGSLRQEGARREGGEGGRERRGPGLGDEGGGKEEEKEGEEGEGEEEVGWRVGERGKRDRSLEERGYPEVTQTVV